MKRLWAVVLSGAVLASSVSASAQAVEGALAPLAPAVSAAPGAAFLGGPAFAVPTLAAAAAPVSAPAPEGFLPVPAPEPSVGGPGDAAPRAAKPNKEIERLFRKLREVVPSSDADLAEAVSRLERLYAEKAPKAAAAGAQPSRLMPEGLPIEWVQDQIGLNREAGAAVLKRRKKARKQGFAKAALNPQVLARHDPRYTLELPVGRVTNQKDSGRCWIFAGLNMLRSTLLAQGKVPKDFEFSENYLYFFNQLENSNRYLEWVLRKTYGKKTSELSSERLDLAPSVKDGGNFTGFQFLVQKYGLVPESAMPETKNSARTAQLDEELNQVLGVTTKELWADARRVARDGGESRAYEIRERGMSSVIAVLSAHLGAPPARFEEGGRSYTPQSFSKDFVGFDFRDYVQVGSWPYAKRGVAYESPGSALGAPEPGAQPVNYRYLNVDVDRLESLAVAALAGGQPVYIYVSMSGRDVNGKTGIMHPEVYDRGPLYDLSPEERAERLSRAQSLLLGLNDGDHLMVLTGFDRPDPAKPVVKFKVENSWGAKRGDRGVFHMYREWFRAHAFSIVVHKSFLTEAERAAWRAQAKPLK